jgi:hypothetical protein
VHDKSCVDESDQKEKPRHDGNRNCQGCDPGSRDNHRTRPKNAEAVGAKPTAA